MGQEQEEGSELRHTETMYGVRCLVQKTAVGKTSRYIWVNYIKVDM